MPTAFDNIQGSTRLSGLCDNLLTCVCRAWPFQSGKSLIVAPAMNTAMWRKGDEIDFFYFSLFYFFILTTVRLFQHHLAINFCSSLRSFLPLAYPSLSALPQHISTSFLKIDFCPNKVFNFHRRTTRLQRNTSRKLKSGELPSLIQFQKRSCAERKVLGLWKETVTKVTKIAQLNLRYFF